MAVLVTGAAGFIGSHVARTLLDQGEQVVGLDALNDAYDVRLKHHRLEGLRARPGFSLVQGDAADDAVLARVPWEDVDRVLHLGARAGVRQSILDPHAYVHDNITGTVSLLEAMRRADVPSLLLASTSSLYGAHNEVPFREDADTDRPLSPYAASKKGAEAMVASYHHLYGMDLPVVRFFTVYGPAGRPDMSVFRFIRWVMEGESVHVYGDGQQGRDFTYVDDIARGVLAASAHRGHRVFNLGGDEPHSILDLLRLVGDLLDEEPRVEFHDAAPADVPRTWADITAARELLGWSPRTSLREGLERTVAWHREHRAFVRSIDLG